MKVMKVGVEFLLSHQEGCRWQAPLRLLLVKWALGRGKNGERMRKLRSPTGFLFRSIPMSFICLTISIHLHSILLFFDFRLKTASNNTSQAHDEMPWLNSSLQPSHMVTAECTAETKSKTVKLLWSSNKRQSKRCVSSCTPKCLMRDRARSSWEMFNPEMARFPERFGRMWDGDSESKTLGIWLVYAHFGLVTDPLFSLISGETYRFSNCWYKHLLAQSHMARVTYHHHGHVEQRGSSHHLMTTPG